MALAAPSTDQQVAIVSRSTAPGVDIDFLFAQVGVDKPMVDTTPNCGNILAGFAPFALERGLIPARHPKPASPCARSIPARLPKS